MIPNSPDRPLLASNAGVVPAPQKDPDPFAALDDLMAVIDTFCPRWPARPPVTGPGTFRL